MGSDATRPELNAGDATHHLCDLTQLLNVLAPFQHQLNGSDENKGTCLIGVCEYDIPLSGARHSTQ